MSIPSPGLGTSGHQLPSHMASELSELLYLLESRGQGTERAQVRGLVPRSGSLQPVITSRVAVLLARSRNLCETALWAGEELARAPQPLRDKQTEHFTELFSQPGEGGSIGQHNLSSVSWVLIVQRPASAEQESAHAGREGERGRDAENDSPAGMERTGICPGELDHTSLRSVEGGKFYVKRMK